MGLTSSLLVAGLGRGPARRFDAATRDPAGTQQQKLVEILQRNRDTEYGREHGFAGITTLADYAAKVPVIDYKDIEARVTRMTRGEKNVLVAEPVEMFARTSGTTGTPKFIPVTPTCRGRDHREQMRTWLFHAQHDHPTLLRGKVMSLVSPAVEGRTDAGIPYGSTSGDMYRNIPRLIRNGYAIPYEVFEIEDADAKYYALMRLGIAADVSFLCTANPSSIVRLCEFADQHADELIRDLADGTVRRDLDMPDSIRSVVEAATEADPQRARQLEAARGKRSGRLLPADYWPNLALVACWKGGTVGSQVERFQPWFEGERGPCAVRDWGYLSSECRGSIPLTDEGCGGVLTIATNVYEFVPVDEVDRDPEGRTRWRFRTVTELEQGPEYYIFITTTGGLYRYDINDVIVVSGHHQATPVIEFKRKGREMTNITGEKVSANQVIAAVESAGKELGLTLEHWKAQADQQNERYLFLVGADQGLAEANGRQFLAAVDHKLGELNIEYAGKRKSQRLKPPALQLMKAGALDARKGGNGKRMFQAKAIVLEPRPEQPADTQPQDQVAAEVTLDGDGGKQPRDERPAR